MTNDNLYQHCDFHIHTKFSPCAQKEMLLPDIFTFARHNGIKHLGISDHIKASTDHSILNKTRDELNSMDKPMQVYLGCEADVLGVGRHTVTEEMVSKLDYIAISANHFHTKAVAKPADDSLQAVADHFLKMFRYACTLDFVDTIVHPLFVFAGTYNPDCLYLLSDEQLVEALTLARDNKIAMEISPRALETSQLDFRLKFYLLCKEVGVKFSIGSDAHRLISVGQTHVLGPLLKRLGITDDDLWLPCK